MEEPEDDSDPLERLVGPLPKPAPAVRRRGRGAFTVAERAGAGALVQHISPGYDPAVDVRPDGEDRRAAPGSGGDWEQALEALRDREKWRRLGAERLRAAGFTEVQVGRWEKRGKRTVEEEGDVVEVWWALEGEGREWDRGKMVDEKGDVKLKAEWAMALDD